MSTPKFPYTVAVKGITGITAKIYKHDRSAEGKGISFMLAYSLLGKRKMESFADFAAAKTEGEAAIVKIANGDQLVLELKNAERMEYLRAKEAAGDTPIDTVCRVWADATAILGGKASIIEAIRDFVKRHNVKLPQISVADAVKAMLEQAKTDGKSQRRRQQLAAVLNQFVTAFNQDVHTLTAPLVADYLTKLNAKERTKRNHRDVIGFFGRWLVMRGYLEKGTDLLDGVQNYSARKVGEISTYSAEDMSKLIETASDRLLPFLVIAGFAGLRHEEIERLEWRDVDLEEGFIEVADHKAKTKTRRIVPIKDNLKAWLKKMAKRSGKVVEIGNISNELLKLSTKSGVAWKRNALRHTFVSARVAECADVPRVADEAGNSVAVIRTNYLKRMRPKEAAVWFSIVPSEVAGEKVSYLKAV